MTESPTALTEGGTPTGIACGVVAVTCGPAAGWIGRAGGCVTTDTTGTAVDDAGVAAAEPYPVVADDVTDDGVGVGDVGVELAGAAVTEVGDDCPWPSVAAP